jgi:hypothetical protein
MADKVPEAPPPESAEPSTQLPEEVGFVALPMRRRHFRGYRQEPETGIPDPSDDDETSQ